MSTLPLESLLAFKKAANLHLCQHVICHNPARLPSPAQWVTIKRTRLKDTYTHVWWMSRSPWAKADNRKVLTPYSANMKKLLARKSYNAGARPSGHVLSPTGFYWNGSSYASPNTGYSAMIWQDAAAGILHFGANNNNATGFGQTFA